jgi:regulation of enolase protein 1 (concanavalin A-like superfamily)
VLLNDRATKLERPRTALKLASAFGGANAALVVSLDRPPPRESVRREVAISRAVRATDIEPNALAARSGYSIDRITRADDLVRWSLAAVAALREKVGDLRGAGIVVGLGLATVETNAKFQARIARPEPRRFPYTTPNAAAGECAVAFGLDGPAFAVGGGPHGGLEAIGLAADLVRAGVIERVVVVAADEAAATSAELAPGTTYFYRIRATGAGGVSENSSAASATTDSAPSAPAAPADLLASAFSSSRIDLTWTDDAADETEFIIERSLNGIDNWTIVATPAQNITSYSDTSGLNAATQYFYRVRAVNGVGPSDNSSVADATTLPAPGLPAEWSQSDIGNTGVAGSASAVDGVLTVEGSGSDIWNASDSFHFVYQALHGDGQIIARVTGMDNTNPWAKAGVMIRESLNANARQVSALLTPRNGIAFIRRTSTAGSSRLDSASGGVPYWVKLIRHGGTITAYRSSNGVNWVSVGSVTVTMSADVLIGLAVCAKNRGTLNTATFTNVAVSTSIDPNLTAAPSTAQTIDQPRTTAPLTGHRLVERTARYSAATDDDGTDPLDALSE